MAHTTVRAALLAFFAPLAACAATPAPTSAPVPATPASAVPASPATAAPAVDHTASIAAGRATLLALVAAEPLAGVQVAVAVRGEIVWSEGLGFADLEQGTRVTPRTRFRFASVSKVVTATLLARAVEAGRLDLDAPVQTYVPTFAQKDPGITARRLAGHLGGIRHYTVKDMAARGQPRHFASVTESLSVFQDDALEAPPGTKYHYSTFGYTLLSAALEGALGRPFLEALAAEIFIPLGMTETGPDDVTLVIAARTRFYEVGHAGTLVPAPDHDASGRWAGGGLLGTAEDLTRLGSALRPEAGFFAPATLELLFRAQSLPDGTSTEVGLGWRTSVDESGRRFYHHAGNMPGARSVIVLFPDDGVVIALLSNVSGRPDPIVPLARELAAPFRASAAGRAGADVAPSGPP